ncbi:MAG: collagen-like protein [Firmicutes bacterium]|nr:collagen-like protein [Bacillota bacterium]
MPQGATGPTGTTGPTGPTGATGPTGTAATLAVGTTTTGEAGTAATVTNTGTAEAAIFDFTIPQGATGPTGAAGGVLNYADFYALMPPDNTATIAPGTDVSFPQDGPTSGADISRTSASAFNLGLIGTYQVLFQVGVGEAGQLVLTLNGDELDYTVVGRATGTSQIIGTAIVTTTTTNSVLTVRNPASNAAALTITPSAGGTEPVSAHLVITQLQ